MKKIFNTEIIQKYINENTFGNEHFVFMLGLEPFELNNILNQIPLVKYSTLLHIAQSIGVDVKELLVSNTNYYNEEKAINYGNNTQTIYFDWNIKFKIYLCFF